MHFAESNGQQATNSDLRRRSLLLSTPGYDLYDFETISAIGQSVSFMDHRHRLQQIKSRHRVNHSHLQTFFRAHPAQEHTQNGQSSDTSRAEPLTPCALETRMLNRLLLESAVVESSLLQIMLLLWRMSARELPYANLPIGSAVNIFVLPELPTCISNIADCQFKGNLSTLFRRL